MIRWAARGALALAGLLLAVVAFELWSLQRDLADARAGVTELSVETIDDAGGLVEAVDPAAEAVERARRRVEGPVVDSLRAVPLIGPQFDAVHDVVVELDQLVDVGTAEVEEVEEVLDQGDGPEGRVELVTRAIQAIDVVVAELDAREPIDRSGLVGPVGGAVADFEREIDDGRADLMTLRERMTTARRLLVGPTSILVLAANNAELRAGMGMHLSAGLVTVRDGAFETSDFVPSDELTDVTQGRAEVPDELDDLFRRVWDFGREWRTTSTTPNFPEVGDVLAQLSERTPIGEVDAVLSLDVPALGPLLEATGPVEIEGGAEPITADNVTDLLLRDIYLFLGEEEQASFRRQLQSDIAKLIFEAVTERDVDVLTLADGVIGATEGRHLLGWSDDPDIQELWESLGATGELSPRSFLVAFQNASASKRDYYIEPYVEVSPLATGDDGSRRFRITATLPNPVVDPTAPYVDSLNPFVPVGVHRAYVTFHLPDGASDIEVRAGDLSVIGSDGPTEVAAVWIRVPEGDSRRAVLDVTFPAGVDAVELIPSARVTPQTYRFGPATVDDRVSRIVALPWVDERVAQEPDYVAAAAFVVLFAALALLVSRSRRLTAPEPDMAAVRADGRLAIALTIGAIGLLVVAALG